MATALPDPVSMQDGNGFSDDYLSEQREGCEQGRQCDLVVERLNGQVVHLQMR